MGLAVQVVATLGDGSMPAGWLTRVQQWLHDNWSQTLIGSAIVDDPQGRLQLSCQLHPAAPDVSFVASGKHEVQFAATTHPVGPGYHAHVCELLRALRDELAADWSPGDLGGDPTGFLDTGDLAALQSAMVVDLQGEILRLLTTMQEGPSPARLNLLGRHDYEVGSDIATPLGPRDRTWLQRASRDADVAREIFPWWNAGVGASCRLGRALTEMWNNVRWRRPIHDEEAGLVDRVLALLESAYAANPKLDYPWAEWRELHDYSWRDTPMPPPPQVVRAPHIGYRRRPVRVHLEHGWTIRLPGTCAERWEDDETFEAWDGTRTVWVSVLRDPAKSAEELFAAFPLAGTGRPLEVQSPHRCRAVCYEVEEREAVRKIEAQIATAGHLAQVTIVIDSPEREPWAVETLGSLQRDDGE
jgi:hypothetical protein